MALSLPIWGGILIFLIGIAALVNVIYQINDQRSRLEKSLRDQQPYLVPHSVRDEKIGMVVRVKNWGEPLLLKNIIVNREKSNFLHSWASTNYESQKVGRKRVLKMEFALHDTVSNHQEATGVFELKYTDVNEENLFSQQIYLESGELSTASPSLIERGN